MNRTVENGRGTLHLRRLVADIVSGAAKNHPEAIRAWRAPREDLRRVATRDYVRQLRRHLGYRELQEMLRLARQVWPGFNRRQLTAAPRELFPTRAARVAGQLRIHLQVKPCGGRDEIALRGFYVEQRPALLERPLIFVNSAHHPGAVSTTFCHEIGHHLTAPLFEHARSPVHFFFDSAYAAHLNDPAELAADAICSLAGYPHPLAVQIFSAPRNWALVAKVDKLPDDVFNRVFRLLTDRYGLNLAATIPIGQRLNYLAGMIHYAKLRWALLDEYDI